MHIRWKSTIYTEEYTYIVIYIWEYIYTKEICVQKRHMHKKTYISKDI